MVSTWKAVERKVAKIAGGKRTGATGRNSEDVGHSTYSFEVKHRDRFPTWLTAAYVQAKKNAPVGKVPLVVLHEKGSRDYMAVLPLSELVRMTGENLVPDSLIKDQAENEAGK
jgi:hypothetical protein